MNNQLPEGFIAYNGPSQPVADGVMVEVFTQREFECGWTSQPQPAYTWDWTIEDVPGDIVGYKLV
jgi:hypothetical protein